MSAQRSQELAREGRHAPCNVARVRAGFLDVMVSMLKAFPLYVYFQDDEAEGEGGDTQAPGGSDDGSAPAPAAPPTAPDPAPGRTTMAYYHPTFSRQRNDWGFPQ